MVGSENVIGLNGVKLPVAETVNRLFDESVAVTVGSIKMLDIVKRVESTISLI